MPRAGATRRRLAGTLRAAYAEGLISEQTFCWRLDQVLKARLINPAKLIGDLNLRAPRAPLRSRLVAAMATLTGQPAWAVCGQESPGLLALDWTGVRQELLIGRHQDCDVVLDEPTVSRRHARVFFRDGQWVFQDLASRNGSVVNGVGVGRCVLRPGDLLRLGHQALLID